MSDMGWYIAGLDKMYDCNPIDSPRIDLAESIHVTWDMLSPLLDLEWYEESS